MSSSSERPIGDSPLRGASPSIPRTNVVPLVTPRYQKKHRAHRHIEVTNSSEERKPAASALNEHTIELLTVHHGKVKFEQEVYFHPYGLFKHGRHKIHSRSVGYSSDGDLVLIREAISEPSDVDLGYVQRKAEIDKAVCLDPKARRPLTDTEIGKKLRLNAPGFRKYPGIRAPKNRKTRNRLLNDYFASKYSKEIMEKYRERQHSEEGKEDMTPPWYPSFAELPPVFEGDFLDLDEDAQTRALEKCGVNVHSAKKNTAHPSRDTNSGEVRFQSLNFRLRGELIHALNSEYLSRQIEDLESAFAKFISDGNGEQPLVFHFRDGYCRLVCHGVAAYYQLVSESQLQADGSKITVVSWPKKRKLKGHPLLLPSISLMQMLRKNRSYMPGKHSCSPISTPQTTPYFGGQQPDALPPPFDLNSTNSTPLACHNTQAWPAAVANSSPDVQNEDKNGVLVSEPSSTDSGVATNKQKKKPRKAMKTTDSKGSDATKDSH